MLSKSGKFYCDDDIFNDDMEYFYDLKLFPLIDADILTSLFEDYGMTNLEDFGAGIPGAAMAGFLKLP